MKKITFLMVCLQTVGFAMYGRPVLSLYSRYLTLSCDRYQRYFPYQDLYFRNYSYNRSMYSSYLYNLYRPSLHLYNIYRPYLNLYNLYSPYLNLYNLYSPYLNLYNLYSPYSSLYSRGLYWYYDPYRYSFSWDRYYPRCRLYSAIGKNNPNPKREQVLFLNQDTQTEDHSRIEKKQPEPESPKVLVLNKYTQTEGHSSDFPKNEESSEKGRATGTHSRKLSCAGTSDFESIRKNPKKRSMSFGLATDSKSNNSLSNFFSKTKTDDAISSFDETETNNLMQENGELKRKLTEPESKCKILEELVKSPAGQFQDYKGGEYTTIRNLQGRKTNTSRSHSFATDLLQNNKIPELNLKFNNSAKNSQQDNKILCTQTERLMGENQEQREWCADLQQQLEKAKAQNQILANANEMQKLLHGEQEKNIENLKKEIADLKGEIDALAQHNQKTEEDIEKITKEKELLTPELQYTDLITEPSLGIESRVQNNDLQDKYQELAEEMSTLKQENQKILECLTKKEEEFDLLEDTYNTLIEHVRKIKNLEEKITILHAQKEIEALTNYVRELEEALKNTKQNQNTDGDTEKGPRKQESDLIINNAVNLLKNTFAQIKQWKNNESDSAEEQELSSSVIAKQTKNLEKAQKQIQEIHNIPLVSEKVLKMFERFAIKEECR